MDHVTDAATGTRINFSETIRLDIEYEPAAEVYDLSYLHVSAFSELDATG